MKELTDWDLRYRPWNKGFKKRAKEAYEAVKREHPEIVAAIFQSKPRSPSFQDVTEAFLIGGNTQREVARQFGVNQRFVSLAPRAALILIGRALKEGK